MSVGISSFLGIWYVNETMCKICRSFYLDLNTYFLYQRKLKGYKIVFLVLLLLELTFLYLFQELENKYLLVFPLTAAPVLLYCSIFYYLYHKQVKDNLHILIIQEASSLCKKFTWSSVTSKNGDKKVIELTCSFPQYKIGSVFKFLKSKFEKYGYTLKIDSSDMYSCTICSEFNSSHRLSLRPTDVEYLYQIEISS